MKKIKLFILAAILILAFSPVKASSPANKSNSDIVISKPVESEEAKVLVMRLYEINEMDLSNLTPKEKKNLRIEVRTIKQQLENLGGGIYISVGAIIIILLLLIILF